MDDKKQSSDMDEEARRFFEVLEKNGQLADIASEEDIAKLPVKVTHVRYPDGRVRRIRFTGYGQGGGTETS